MSEHNHNHNHNHHSDIENLKVAFFLNLLFTIFEIIGGFFTNSIAILSDAVHDLGDSLSLGLAWYFQRISKKKADTNFSYGYKRFSILGAIINSIVLIVGSIFILSEALPRLFHPEETNAKGMFFLAILGVIVNGAAVFKLKKGNSINEKVVSLHLLEDVLGWLAILIGSVLMYFFDISILDPLMSIGIALFVIFNVYKNISQTMRIILQGIPKEMDITQISTNLLQFEEIIDLHDLHLWSVDGSYNVLTIHIVLKNTMDLENLSLLKLKIRQTLKSFGIQHITIEFETQEENCDFIECCQ